MSAGTLVPLLVFLIPILGIVLAGYKEWLQFKAKQQELGASTEEVESTIQDLQRRIDDVEQERDALIRRVQNLETIVTSEAWDALPETSPPASALPDDVESSDPDTASTQREAPSIQEQAETLARRLRS
jgi:chromosome segregation ATPase